jgi:hypothetical protein
MGLSDCRLLCFFHSRRRYALMGSSAISATRFANSLMICLSFAFIYAAPLL